MHLKKCFDDYSKSKGIILQYKICIFMYKLIFISKITVTKELK